MKVELRVVPCHCVVKMMGVGECQVKGVVVVVWKVEIVHCW